MGQFKNVPNRISKACRDFNYLLVACLGFLLLATAGCSTPVVPDNSATSVSDQAWLDYKDCLRRMTALGRANECVIHSSKAVLSFDDYISKNNVDVTPQLQSDFASLEPELDASYRLYLGTLPAETLTELSATWKQVGVNAE